jgi:hypothetical protein
MKKFLLAIMITVTTISLAGCAAQLGPAGVSLEPETPTFGVYTPGYYPGWHGGFHGRR